MKKLNILPLVLAACGLTGCLSGSRIREVKAGFVQNSVVLANPSIVDISVSVDGAPAVEVRQGGTLVMTNCLSGGTTTIRVNAAKVPRAGSLVFKIKTGNH